MSLNDTLKERTTEVSLEEWRRGKKKMKERRSVYNFYLGYYGGLQG